MLYSLCRLRRIKRIDSRSSRGPFLNKVGVTLREKEYADAFQGAGSMSSRKGS